MNHLTWLEINYVLMLPVIWCGCWQIGVWIGKAINRRNGWYEQTEWVRRDKPRWDSEWPEF